MVSGSTPVIGWREWVALPQLGGVVVKAKVDTGARTSALHAFNIELSESDGRSFVAFDLHPVQHRRNPTIRVEAPVAEFRDVKSSNGQIERRPVITTTLDMGVKRFSADLTLTNRDEMGFRMLLGRGAIRRRFLVDPARSFRGLQPPRDP